MKRKSILNLLILPVLLLLFYSCNEKKTDTKDKKISQNPLSVRIPSEFMSSSVKMINHKNISELMKDPYKFDDLKSKDVSAKLDLEPYALAIFKK